MFDLQEAGGLLELLESPAGDWRAQKTRILRGAHHGDWGWVRGPGARGDFYGKSESFVLVFLVDCRLSWGPDDSARGSAKSEAIGHASMPSMA